MKKLHEQKIIVRTLRRELKYKETWSQVLWGAVLRIQDVYPGSKLSLSRIPDPQKSKKMVSKPNMIRDVLPGSGC
jgi:hypothetical protein